MDACTRVVLFPPPPTRVGGTRRARRTTTHTHTHAAIRKPLLLRRRVVHRKNHRPLDLGRRDHPP